MKYGLFVTRRRILCVERARFARRRQAFSQAREAPQRPVYQAKIILRRTPPRERRRGSSRLKTRESVPTDSLRRRLRACRGAAAQANFAFVSRRRRRARRAGGERAQAVRRFLSRSLTACGLALPPDAFITWPTNQPIAFGLVLASPTLSGFLAMMSSTSFSSAERSVTC